MASKSKSPTTTVTLQLMAKCDEEAMVERIKESLEKSGWQTRMARIEPLWLCAARKEIVVTTGEPALPEPLGGAEKTGG